MPGDDNSSSQSLSSGLTALDNLKASLAGIVRLVMGHWAREQMLRLLLALLWMASAYLAGFLWFGQPLESVDRIHVMLAYILPVLSFVLFPANRFSASWRRLDYLSAARPVFVSVLAVALAGLVITFLMHAIGPMSRMWYLSTVSLMLVSSLSVRMAAVALMRWLRRNGIDICRVLVIGHPHAIAEGRRLAQENPGFGYAVVASLDEEQAGEAPHVVERCMIEEVWVMSRPDKIDGINEIVSALGRTAIPVRWLPNIDWLALVGYREENLMGQPSLVLNATAMESSEGRLVKSLFDRLFALVVLIGLSPLLVAIALLVKLSSPGPVFFRQLRQGISGKPFHCLKFRSMVVHCEEGCLTQASANDPRITRVGAFLRRTSLDELPQFINVLLGDMSVVGPRPHAIQHNELYSTQVERYMQRHRTKPGITGWAQINGYRGETRTLETMAKRIEYDLYYMQHWSFMLDLKIIFWTAFKGWTGKNAY